MSATATTPKTYPTPDAATAGEKKMTHIPQKRTQFINLALLASIFKRHRVLLIVIALCVAAYSVMIIAMWPLFIDDSLQEMMDQLAASIPGFDAGAFSMTLGQYLETQWLGVYWLPLAGSVMIVVAAKAIAGSVVDGSLEVICTSPCKRSTYLTTVVVALFVIAAILSVATMVPLVLCGPAFEADFEVGTTALLLLASLLILFVFGLFVLAVSAWTRGNAIPAAVAVAFILVMLVLYIATPSVEALEVLEPVNLLHWWGSAVLIDEGKLEPGLWIWLATVGAASLAAAFAGFLRRDLT